MTDAVQRIDAIRQVKDEIINAVMFCFDNRQCLPQQVEYHCTRLKLLQMTEGSRSLTERKLEAAMFALGQLGLDVGGGKSAQRYALDRLKEIEDMT